MQNQCLLHQTHREAADFSFAVPPLPAFLLRIETVASSKVQEDAAKADEVAHSSSKVCEI